MKKTPLYKIIRPDGGTTITTRQPDGDYVPYWRLIADEGKAMTNGTLTTPAVDVPDGDEAIWVEIEDPEGDVTPEELFEMMEGVL